VRVCEKRVLGRICGPKRENLVASWRRLHNEDHLNLYTSQNVKVIKSRRMRWAGHVARMGEMRNTYKILVRKPGGKIHSEDLGVDGKIILE
jgi:hypothetical protein